MLTLYSYFRSSAAYRVRIALALKGLAFDTAVVHLLRGGGEQLQDTYRSLNRPPWCRRCRTAAPR